MDLMNAFLIHEVASLKRQDILRQVEAERRIQMARRTVSREDRVTRWLRPLLLFLP